MQRQSPIAFFLAVLVALGPAAAQEADEETGAEAVRPDLGAPSHAFDHLVVAISDLDAGIETVGEQLGVRPAFGGEHPHSGTHNALLSLGPGSYLEVVAPRPGADASELASWIAGFDEPTPILWAVATSDAAATRARLSAAGFETSEPSPGSRQTPEGRTLEWATFGLARPQLAAAPFFIAWGEGTRHPSATSPTGCQLTGLTVVSDDNAEMRRLLELLEIEAEVAEGERPALRATLDCPAGEVELGTAAGG